MSTQASDTRSAALFLARAGIRPYTRRAPSRLDVSALGVRHLPDRMLPPRPPAAESPLERGSEDECAR